MNYLTYAGIEGRRRAGADPRPLGIISSSSLSSSRRPGPSSLWWRDQGVAEVSVTRPPRWRRCSRCKRSRCSSSTSREEGGERAEEEEEEEEEELLERPRRFRRQELPEEGEVGLQSPRPSGRLVRTPPAGWTQEEMM